MSHAFWKVAAFSLAACVAALIGYVSGHMERLIPSAFAQTAPSSITLAKPYCTSQVSNQYGTQLAVGIHFVCIADLDGNGKQEVIIGSSQPTATTGGTNPQWEVRILDGTGAERGSGAKLTYLP